MLRLKHHTNRNDFSTPIYKRSWTCDELIKVFPAFGLKILDVGAGASPFPGRKIDGVVTVDFDSTTEQTIICDFTVNWPFEKNKFDLIYASHVIEHLYPQDRDKLVMNIYESLKVGGYLFVRVPHWSSIQGTGFEHYTLYGTNGLTSLCHGKNPNLPHMEMISTGVAFGQVDRFYKRRNAIQILLERLLNISFRLTDSYLCHIVGGIPEVQFLLRKPHSSIPSK